MGSKKKIKRLKKQLAQLEADHRRAVNILGQCIRALQDSTINRLLRELQKRRS